MEERGCGRGKGEEEGEEEGRRTQRRAGEEEVVMGHTALGQEAEEDCFGGPGFLASPKRYPRIQSWEPLRDRAMMRFADSRERNKRTEDEREMAAESPTMWHSQR